MIKSGFDQLIGKRILVTGASGFLGCALVRRLVSEGAVVSALSRTMGRLSESAGEGFEFLQCDLSDAQETVRVMAAFEPEILFHFAAHPDGRESFSHAQKCIQANTLMTLNALEAFRLASGELFVYGDSCKVYGNCDVPYLEATPAQPISAYAIAKTAGWQLCDLYSRVYNLHALSIRPTMIYGPRQSFNLISFVVDCVLDGKCEVVLDGGSQTRDPLYVDDAVAAYVSTARLGPSLSRRIVNIGGGNEHSVLHLAALVLELMGADLRVVEAPGRTRPTETKRSYCDNQESRGMLGWQPRVSLREGLARTIQYLVQSRGRSMHMSSHATGASAD